MKVSEIRGGGGGVTRLYDRRLRVLRYSVLTVKLLTIQLLKVKGVWKILNVFVYRVLGQLGLDGEGTIIFGN
jgi:hypothetical protein